jgi:uncharacterized protein YllA (UPF0747 family)
MIKDLTNRESHQVVSSLIDPNLLYEEASLNQNSDINFWGKVPKSYFEAVKQTISEFSPNKYGENDIGKETLETLKQFLKSWHREMGISSMKVEENIERIDIGTILMGQQPVVFGGPGFIGNKFGCLAFLDKLFAKNDKKLAPIFFVGDYDGIQKELARVYYPNPISHSAFILDSEDFLPEDSNIAAHQAKLPPQDWLEEYLHKLTENLRGFKKPLKGPNKALFEERWDHLRTIIRSSFNSSSTLSEWAAKIWGTLANLSADLGIVFFPTSHPVIRKLVAPQYHRLIQNRAKYAEKFIDFTKEVEVLGYKPSLPHRHDNYAPFTLECTFDYNRIITTIVEKESDVYAEGNCTSCNTLVSHKVTSPEDIGKIATIIGPRVDTSQAIFQDLLNIRIRISGPGEIAYYTQVAPTLRSIGFDLPIFVKYKRAFYGKSSIEKLGKELVKRNQGSLHHDKLFEILRLRMIAAKAGDIQKVQEAEMNMHDFIKEQYSLLLAGKQSIDVMKYLGWQFGRFTPQKFGQEVSWVWFDLAIQTGATDYIKTYSRMYTDHSLVGTYYFINSLL